METSEITLPVVMEDGPRPDVHAGMAALAAMTPQEFNARLEGLKRGQERILQIHRTLMREGPDYAVIPGTQKPTLLKAGAERLAHFYGLIATFIEEVRYGGEGQPPITIVMKCYLHLGEAKGSIVAEGGGAANSWERKYRRAQGQDAYDLLNTLLKMAQKRAFVDAVLRATATSALYTQDLERDETTPQAQQTRQEPARGASGKKPASGQGKAEKPATTPYDEVKDELGKTSCQWPQCHRLLTLEEILGCRKRWGDERYCSAHGKDKIAAEKAAGEEMAATPEEDIDTDPFEWIEGEK